MRCELTLSEADLDLMYEFLDRSMGRVMCQKYWYAKRLPQGVSVFTVHPVERCDGHPVEYMFTKDEKYGGSRDWISDRDEVLTAIARYIPVDYTGIVYYMNRDAVPLVSRHVKIGGGRHAIS